MYEIRDRKFFEQNANDVAKKLLGKIICYKTSKGAIIRCRIMETEAYSNDEKCCYGYKKNPKNRDYMFYSVGKICIYAGMIMISCYREDKPDNVLIRNLDQIIGPINSANALFPRDKKIELDKLCETDLDLVSSDKIWIEDNNAPFESVEAKRVGLTLEKDPEERPWRHTITKLLIPLKCEK